MPVNIYFLYAQFTLTIACEKYIQVKFQYYFYQIECCLFNHLNAANFMFIVCQVHIKT